MKNVPPRLRHLNTWPPVGGAIGGGLGRTVLLEEVCFWGQALGVDSLTWLLVHTLCSMPAVKDVISQCPVPIACCHA